MNILHSDFLKIKFRRHVTPKIDSLFFIALKTISITLIRAKESKKLKLDLKLPHKPVFKTGNAILDILVEPSLPWLRRDWISARFTIPKELFPRPGSLPVPDYIFKKILNNLVFEICRKLFQSQRFGFRFPIEHPPYPNRNFHLLLGDQIRAIYNNRTVYIRFSSILLAIALHAFHVFPEYLFEENELLIRSHLIYPREISVVLVNLATEKRLGACEFTLTFQPFPAFEFETRAFSFITETTLQEWISFTSINQFSLP